MTTANDLLERLKAQEAEANRKAERAKQARINILSQVKFYDPCDTLEDNIEAYIEAKTAEIREALNKAFAEEEKNLEGGITRTKQPFMRRVL